MTNISNQAKVLEIADLLEIEKQIGACASKPIVFSPPLITFQNAGIIRRGTINIVQGKFGSHKSRISQVVCSLLLSNTNDSLLGFEKQPFYKPTVCYIDTERNLEEEFPAAIQAIKQAAGYTIEASIPELRYTSIKQILRTNRLKSVKNFIEHIRNSSKNDLFVVLDVATDCISNFNDPEESLAFFDYLGNLCENYKTTFLLVIHENPFSDKARGHLGTEGGNKASSVMSIGFVKDKKNHDTDLLELKFLKIRSAKRPESVFLKFDETTNGLVLANSQLVNKVMASRKEVADIELVAHELGSLLKPSLSQQDVLRHLKGIFNCSEHTLKTRLEEIAGQQMEITNENQRPCTLQIKSVNGKATIYELQEIDYEIVELL